MIERPNHLGPDSERGRALGYPRWGHAPCSHDHDTGPPRYPRWGHAPCSHDRDTGPPRYPRWGHAPRVDRTYVRLPSRALERQFGRLPDEPAPTVPSVDLAMIVELSTPSVDLAMIVELSTPSVDLAMIVELSSSDGVDARAYSLLHSAWSPRRRSRDHDLP